MRGGVRWGFVWIGISVCVGAGCGVTSPPPSSDSAGGSETGGECSLAESCASGGTSGGSGGDASGGKPPLIIPEDEEEPDCLSRCTSDLQAVVDCEGMVQSECTDGQACLDAVCQDDACAAAAAGQSSMGCDFWVLKTDIITEGASFCFAAVVANTWTTPLTIDVSQEGASVGTSFIYLPRGQGAALTYEAYDPTVGVPAGDVAVLFFSDSLVEGASGVCPRPPLVDGHVGVFGSQRGHAFRIQTSEPAAVYSILPYGGGVTAATSASLLLPTSRWEREYIAINPFEKSSIVATGVPSLDILAAEDGTTVDILPVVDIVGGEGVDPGLAGEPITYLLDQGEYLQISQAEELTGSIIVADKPIAVWGAASCLNVPIEAAACDSAHQQLPPVSAMGSEYVGVRHRSRDAAAGVEELSPWRIVAAVDGTTLSWEPAPPDGVPTSLDRGDVAEFWTDTPFVVRSQDDEHPFYVGQYMTGAAYVSASGLEGDPEWVNVVPAQQYLTGYVFFTDPTYPETSLVVVRAPDEGGAFADVVLECAGALTDWQPVGPYEFTRVRLVQGDFQDIGACSNGIQRMESDLPFGVTVWGWGTATTEPQSAMVSYAYPAGVGLKTVNEVRLPPPVVK